MPRHRALALEVRLRTIHGGERKYVRRAAVEVIVMRNAQGRRSNC